jgi:hypothetical protein
MLARLHAPEEDVRALCAILNDRSRGEFSVELSLNDSYLDVRDRVIDLFQNRQPLDVVLLYYSGHGILERNDRLFLTTVESSHLSPVKRSFLAQDVRDMMILCRAEAQIIILDCCHSGAFGKTIKGSSPAVTQATFDIPGRRQYVLTASAGLQVTYDADPATDGATSGARLSPFTSWLVDGLNGDAAPEEDEITMDALATYTLHRAQQAGSDAQPQRFVQGNVRHLPICRNPNRTAKIAGDIRTAIDSENWIERLGAVKFLCDMTDNKSGDIDIRRILEVRLEIERNPAVRGAITDVLEQEPFGPKVKDDAKALEADRLVARPTQAIENMIDRTSVRLFGRSSIAWNYQYELRQSLSYWPTWLPHRLISPGDVGLFTHGTFSHVTSLSEMGIDYSEETSPGGEFEYTSTGCGDSNMVLRAR